MRVSSINTYSTAQSYTNRVTNVNRYNKFCYPKPAFNGQAGRILGIIVGGAAAVAAAIAVAPVLICAGPIAGTAGMIAGDKIQEKAKGNSNDNAGENGKDRD